MQFRKPRSIFAAIIAFFLVAIGLVAFASPSQAALPKEYRTISAPACHGNRNDGTETVELSRTILNSGGHGPWVLDSDTTVQQPVSCLLKDRGRDNTGRVTFTPATCDALGNIVKGSVTIDSEWSEHYGLNKLGNDVELNHTATLPLTADDWGVVIVAVNTDQPIWVEQPIFGFNNNRPDCASPAAASVAKTSDYTGGGVQAIWKAFPACVFEDGSGGVLPCKWDAKVRGNKQGQSYWFDANRVQHWVGFHA